MRVATSSGQAVQPRTDPASEGRSGHDTFTTHDKLSALEVLRGVEALVLVGSKDLVTPEDHSRAMAAVLPDAHLVVVEGAGHMVPLECGPLVTLHLRALVRRATGLAA